MKKISLIILFPAFVLGLQNAKAQSNWEIGVRFPQNVSLDVTVPLSAAPRLQTAVYFDRFGIGTYFDWMFALGNGPKGLKFYPGLGPEVFFESQFDFHAAGTLGTEYSFNFPITIGFDWRPSFRFTNGTDLITDRWGFIARFRFGEGVSFKRAD